jgi:hypothetical protein
VNGGKSVPVLVDTGSTGLVIPLQDIGIKSLLRPNKLTNLIGGPQLSHR